MELRTDVRKVDGFRKGYSIPLNLHDGCVVAFWNKLLSKHLFAIRNITRGEGNPHYQLRCDKII
jgi:hypothetical protein